MKQGQTDRKNVLLTPYIATYLTETDPQTDRKSIKNEISKKDQFVFLYLYFQNHTSREGTRMIK